VNAEIIKLALIQLNVQHEEITHNLMQVAMRVILVMFFLTTVSISEAQRNEKDSAFTSVDLPNHFREGGVIFNKDYNVGIVMKSVQRRYTPTENDILSVEMILSNHMYNVQKDNLIAKPIFYHWVRQYIGLIDTNGNKNIIVQLVDNSNPRKMNRLLGKNWQCNFAVMLSDDFYRLSKRYQVNINTKEVSDVI
jgi:hypothetical protein